MGRYEDALEAFEHTLELNPRLSETWYNKGMVLSNLDNPGKALESYDHAIAINPHHLQALTGKGIVLGELSRHEDALEAFERVIDFDAQIAGAWTNKGAALGKLGMFHEALNSIDKALDLNPRLAPAWGNKAVILAAISRHREALKAFEKALEIDPSNPDIHTNYARLLFDLGDLKGADKKAGKALQEDPEHLDALHLKGRIQIGDKKYADARESFKNAISLDLGNPGFVLWDAYADHLKTEYSNREYTNYKENTNQIINKLERLIESLGSDHESIPYIHYFLGFLYYKNKEYFKAMDKLKACLGLHPGEKIKKSSLDLLDHTWKHKIRPSWWRWWMDAPLFRSAKRILLAVLVISILGLLSIHPFVPDLFSAMNAQVSWSLYGLLSLFFVFILLSPAIITSGDKESEFEPEIPPVPEPVLSVVEMEPENTEK
jgi:tetratricopeptide (TPR) repeat protein